MIVRIPVYVFRDPHFAPARDTVACAAPIEEVVKVYGGGGLLNTAGLISVFRGAAVYRDSNGKTYLGVWGARKAAKFRGALRRQDVELAVIEATPPARLVWYSTRPTRRSKRTTATFKRGQ